MIKNIIESKTGLQPDEITVLETVLSTKFRDLDHCENELKGWFGTAPWLVYRGGNHVALIKE